MSRKKLIGEFKNYLAKSVVDSSVIVSIFSKSIDQARSEAIDDVVKMIDDWEMFCCGHTNAEHKENDCPGWSVEDNVARKVFVEQIRYSVNKLK